VENLDLSNNSALSSARQPENSIKNPWNNAHLRCWENKLVEQHTVALPDKCLDELHNVASHSNTTDIPLTPRENLSACVEFAANIREILMQQSGLVIINRFAVERYDVATNRELIGLFSNLIAPLMAQDIAGTTLYDVIDTGASDDGKVRRSKTNASQPFHTDGPWFDVPPQLVGLFCIQPAASGGLSQASSLQVALKHLKESSQIDFRALYSPAYWNRMSEHGENESRYSLLPVAEFRQNELLLRHYADYVTSGYCLADQSIPSELHSALELLDQSLLEHACEPFRMEAGQLQYLNNRTVAHARRSFQDEEQSNSISENGARHLIRLWNHLLDG